MEPDERNRRQFTRVSVCLRVRLRVLRREEASTLREQLFDSPSVWAPEDEALLLKMATGGGSGSEGSSSSGSDGSSSGSGSDGSSSGSSGSGSGSDAEGTGSSGTSSSDGASSGSSRRPSTERSRKSRRPQSP